MFAGLKEKFNQKLEEFKATPQELALDKHVGDLVDKATSEDLIAPDWALSFAVIDWVNADVRIHSGRALKAIRRSLLKPNSKVQLLSLTLLETCVKNCPEEFHTHLATSELWQDVVRLAGDTSITRVDAEVRDKMLGQIEDYAKALKPQQFMAAYESLLDRGTDFPVRGADDAVPILTPPDHRAPVAPAAAPAPGEPGAAPAADPLEGVDEQDRAAIQAALAELDAEAAAAAEAARVAAEADAEEARLRREQQAAEAEATAAVGLVAAAQLADAAAAAGHPAAPAVGSPVVAGVPAGAGAEHAVAQAAAPGTGSPAGAAPAAAAAVAAAEAERQQLAAVAAAEAAQARETPEERTKRHLETASNSCLLLSETLAGVSDAEPAAVREAYVVELAQECSRLRARLERDVGTVADEALLAAALSQHEELVRVLGRYEELLAAAVSLDPEQQVGAEDLAALSGPGAESRPSDVNLLPHHYGKSDGTRVVPPERDAAAVAAAAAREAKEAAAVAGQKVSAVAAALKTKVGGAFDRLMAAASGARGPAPPPGYAAAPSMDFGPNKAASATGGPGDAGTFTLLDEGDEEDSGGLVARRVAPSPGPEAAAAAAAPPPPLQPAGSSAAAPDLICLDDEPPAQAGAEVPTLAATATAAVAAGSTDAPAGVPVSSPLPSHGGASSDGLVEALDALVTAESIGAKGSAGAPEAQHLPAVAEEGQQE
ncbi:hypothetical protein HYH03_013980 [Edaphochlamys debaryana]|uniref:VHS domain-containing protein n=1 Tax=Edaphochlamys debaryana TaxID=47281 RepID=A0A835XP05_9CHLO|nr:hypothetical protein HYH03_013980 [Edaphochlamys debaryana]|eukprot:KAG2487411.1 hypothetical protein HYH03_013980 [Edaphochlamys debaryana]